MEKSCINCKYYSNTCGRYLMNPELLKDPKECGRPETGYPHWELKLTDELISKAIAPYYGTKLWYRGTGSTTAFKLDGTHIGSISNGSEEYTLILKPLSEITDEDAHKVGMLCGCSMLGKAIGTGKELCERIMIERHLCLISYSVYQHLQSRGYDLPNYFLGNKTLHESGLAIYK